MRCLLLTILIFVAVPTSKNLAQEPSFKEAVQLVETFGGETTGKLLERWNSSTKALKWIDVTGKHTVEARYIDSSDTEVTLEKLDGTRIKIPQAKLQFNARTRIKNIEKIRTQIISDAIAIKEVVALEIAKQEQIELAEKKRQEYERSLTPEQREIQREIHSTAKELSQAGRDRQKSLVLEIINGSSAENAVRTLQWIESAQKMQADFTKLYLANTLTDEAVKEIVKQYGGGKGSIKYLEGLLFGEDNENLANILVKEQPLVTQLDVYYAAGRTLRPEIRKTYGFNQIDALERMGDKLYWNYIYSEKMKKTR